MLAIRMRRVGAKKRPFFRVVVTEGSSPRDGSFIETLGYYDPTTKPETVKVDRARLAHWLKVGATPSDTVRTVVARNPEPPAPAEGAAVAAEQPAS